MVNEIELNNKLTDELLERYEITHTEKKDGKLHIFTTKNLSIIEEDDLRVLLNRKIELFKIQSEDDKTLITGETEVDKVLKEIEGNNFLGKYKDKMGGSDTENLEEIALEAPVINLVNALISASVKKSASDIHIESYEKKVTVRNRIDGILYVETVLPGSLSAAVTTRIKIMSNLNIAERRLPQEGRIRIKISGREMDIRVSIMPSLHGENITLRLLDKSESLLEIDNIGFDKDTYDKYMELIKKPNGIILVTGPTGSGKTTTLYATLNFLNSTEKKIITIEDPIEYQLEGINQIQVKPEIDFTFAAGLKSILRQDPDIIMIGEIRDAETAKIAIQAALTGHLVFATLHTNDSAGAVTRLLDIGVENYLLASALKGVMAQRLVRKLCPKCRDKHFSTESEIKMSNQALNKKDEIYLNKGCLECENTGYDGRAAVYELLLIDDDLKTVISGSEGEQKIKEIALAKGMRTLYEDGIDKVKQGVTSLEEVIKATMN